MPIPVTQEDSFIISQKLSKQVLLPPAPEHAKICQGKCLSLIVPYIIQFEQSWVPEFVVEKGT